MAALDMKALVRTLASEAQAASRVLARSTTGRKNAVLARAAQGLRGEGGAAVLEANELDLGVAQDLNLSATMADRLRLDGARLAALAERIETVRRLPDPVGEVEGLIELDSGIRAGRMRVPLGVIAVACESRPNVTADAAALCLKSGNACVLRSGKESFHTAEALTRIFTDALAAEALPAAAVTLLPSSQRDALLALLALDDLVDVVIPRGGDALVQTVVEHARMPVLRHEKGVCHVYVDDGASYDQVERIVVNAKIEQPRSANALETLLVARGWADGLLAPLCARLSAQGVVLRGCPETRHVYPEAKLSPEPDYDAAYGELVLNVRVVADLDAALAHIMAHGSRHTESIVTEHHGRAERFMREVEASAVMVNASPRFNDGSALGLGAEIAVSTTKLHAWGPVGLSALCTKKWIVYGDGQVRV